MFLHRAPRALPRIGSALGAALTIFALSGEPANAADSSRIGEGLHISAGALVDPDNRTWVADHNAGFCRMSPAGADGPAQIEHPQVPGQGGLRTCLGGLLPDAGTGPDAAGQPVLVDPNPVWEGDEMALIPDGASPSSDVIRARWNPATGLFEYHDRVVMNADRGRPTVLSLGPDGAVYVGFQRETTIQRIVGPASVAPSVQIVGQTADGRGAQLLAAGRDAAGQTVVYTSEDTGIGVLRPVGGTVRTTEPAPFDVDPAVTAVGAMYYDLEDDFLYIGTANGADQLPPAEGIDTVLQVDPEFNTITPYAGGFSMVGGIAKAARNELLVLDDPALLDEAEPLGTGRLFHVGLPVAHVTGGPIEDDDTTVTGRDGHTADKTPSFTVTGEGDLECVLRGPGENGGWEDCGTGVATFTPGDELAEGSYILSVRAVRGEVEGKPEAFRFTVDTTPPTAPVIAAPANGKTVGLGPWFEFSSEDHARFACAWGAEETFTACEPGWMQKFTADEAGEKVLRVVATDRAGNSSEPSQASRFVVDPAVTDESPLRWPAGPPAYDGSSLFSAGLHISTGAIVDPNHRTWIADHNGGFCRVTEPGDDGAGTIDHPSVPGGAGPRTCLGGLLPEAGTGPDAAGQPVYIDPTPEKNGNGDEVVLIPDGASASGEVVRAKWNPGSGLFEFDRTITMTTARSRPTHAAVGPDGAVYVIFQKTANVERINNPTGAQPTVDVVGQAADGAEGLAVGVTGDEQRTPIVYLAEATGITQLVPNATTTPLAGPSRFTVPATDTLAALAYDAAGGYLYAGTANATTPGADKVHRFKTNTGDADIDWLTGYSMIGGLFVRPDGVLYIHDDPALLDETEPIGTGRMYHVGLPAAHVAADSKTHTNDPTPEFVVSGDETVQCRLRGPAGLDTKWATCATDAPWTPAQELADGDYTLSVRSVVFPEAPAEAPAEEPAGDGETTPAEDAPATEVTGDETAAAETAAAEAEAVVEPEVVGLVESHRFTVDTDVPERPSITAPADGALVGQTPWFVFAAEEGVTFECSWNDRPDWAACEEGWTRSFEANGNHTLTIRAVDAAGNTSAESAPRAFSARGVIEDVTITSGPNGPTNDTNPVFAFGVPTFGAEFTCRVDSGAFARCTSPMPLSGLTEGVHTFEVQARDEAGNLSPVARRTFRVDVTKPVISTPDLGEGSVVAPDVRFALAVNEGATLACTIDRIAVGCGEVVDLRGLADGEHTFAVTATDAAGNAATLTRRFTVDAAAFAVPEVAEAIEGVVRTAPLQVA
ncbi:MAG TPA: Ig-like domain-containing protein, partial [Solirubrobacteraceae bacterium]|nr:Ig-like domain-containing protein [Solirubrobacteraceae bacterium]